MAIHICVCVLLLGEGETAHTPFSFEKLHCKASREGYAVLLRRNDSGFQLLALPPPHPKKGKS